MVEYDLIVIGAGSGGLVAATTGHRKGLKTALIEKNKIGGECTHYGCVPSKALLNAAKAYKSISKMKDLGIDIQQPQVDFKKIMEQVDKVVQGIYAHETPDVFEKMGIDVYVNTSGAMFLDQNTVSVGDKTLKAKNFIICTGSSPRILPIEGIEKVQLLHNENFWELRKQPKKIVFIGGGVISVELGQALAQLGSEVVFIERNERILKVTDPEIGAHLTKALEKDGIQSILNANIKAFKNKNTLIYEVDGVQKNIQADYFFSAAGRSANVKGLDLENANIAYLPHGISTNKYLQTSVPHIYACGDVTTRFKFTHTASHQANIAIHNILKPQSKEDDLSVLPWAIFTTPQIGHVGLNEAEAIAKIGKSNIRVFTVNASIDRFITDRNTGGFLKVIFDTDHLVIGAEAVGAHAGEWIQILTIAIKNRIPATKMADTIFAYPTYTEIVKKAFTRYLRTLP
ncbi:dihydrolipoyl dehydrogenase family protein [Hyunsoonleella ulvae]|uniref:dihydrolipoyl dehydrogenase family protein n=1 Tax=Hyunsoonleella ulvae TaxID=2799948 RepID=UPI00193A7D04|nr:NAD(P)/FAD-dependent oxidoreductase [Hyunsoonleella ulvae]